MFIKVVSKRFKGLLRGGASHGTMSSVAVTELTHGDGDPVPFWSAVHAIDPETGEAGSPAKAQYSLASRYGDGSFLGVSPEDS